MYNIYMFLKKNNEAGTIKKSINQFFEIIPLPFFLSLALSFIYFVFNLRYSLVVILAYSVAIFLSGKELAAVYSNKSNLENENFSIKKILILLGIVFVLTIFASSFQEITIMALQGNKNISDLVALFFIALTTTPFFLTFIFSYYYFFKLAQTEKIKKFLSKQIFLIIWSIWFVYTTSITLSYFGGNGYVPDLATPLYLGSFTDYRTKESLRLLYPHLQWYDYFLLLTIIKSSDGITNTEAMFKDVYKLDQDMSFEDLIENLRATAPRYAEQLQRDGKCEFEGKEQSPEISLPTRTWFGLYYKNFLISCNYIDFETNIGVGSNLPREKK